MIKITFINNLRIKLDIFKVIFNEKRVDIITKTDGLYNTVLAHEVGHWILHVENTGLNTFIPIIKLGKT